MGCSENSFACIKLAEEFSCVPEETNVLSNQYLSNENLIQVKVALKKVGNRMYEERYEFLHKVIAEEQDISTDRVDKLASPLLVIGLGGSGSEAVHVIKSTFAKRYNLPVDADGNTIPVPRNTAYLVIDSDSCSQGDLAADEFCSIAVPGLAAILDPRNRETNPWEKEWLNKNLNDCFGDYSRQMARLLLSRNFDYVFDTIAGKLRDICKNARGSAGCFVNIAVVTSLTGHAGSGTFLDVAQIVRTVMERDAELTGLRYRVAAYLIMPDVSCAVVGPAHPLQIAFKSNAYAALKELDFWMGYESKHKTQYTMQYTADAASRITWVKPFDVCTLMSGTTLAGKPYNHPKKVVYNTIAEQLFFYFVDETKNSRVSFDHFEDSIRWAVGSLTKELPANHCYRAIGAYTKKIPKKKILYYEGSRLFSTFMPDRNEQGELQPVDKLVQRGIDRIDVINICGDLQGHYKRFTDVVKLPEFCNIRVEDTNRIEYIRNMQPMPHDQDNIGNEPWHDSVLIPKARESAEQYLEITWKNFVAYAKNVITDPAYGPYALLEYLTEGQNTLRTSLKELIQNWSSTADNFRGGLTGLKNGCNTAWPNFVKPPLFGRRAALEKYRQCLFNYYDGLRRAVFAGAFAKALEKFGKRLDEYRDQALSRLCRALDHMDTDFADGGAEQDDASSELFTLEDVKDSLESCFQACNANERMTREFLSCLCDISFSTEENPDGDSSGVAFTFARDGLSGLYTSLREKLEQYFGSVNAASMDQILINQVGDNAAIRQAEMDKQARSIMSSACPMFFKDPATSGTPHAEFAFLAVPDNAPGYLNHYKGTLGDWAATKCSPLRDRIFCLRIYDGMPLYMYSQMQELEQAYAICIPDPVWSKGLHLVWDGERDSDVNHNWSKLPSPRPFYYFSNANHNQSKLPSPSPFYYVNVKRGTADEQDFEAAQQMVERALACGMLTIDDSASRPSYTLRIKDVGAEPDEGKVFNLILREVAAIDQMRDPITNNPLTEVQKLKLLQDYQQDATVRVVTGTANPMCMQKYLELTDQPCDPFRYGAAADPITLETAWKNHKRLSQALVAALICDDPVTRLAMENQLKGMEYVQKRIDDINKAVKAWEPRIQYAETAARMMIFGLITINRGTIGYTLDGVTSALIQPELLQDDLRNVDNYTKCAGYLADLSADDPVRCKLEAALSAEETGLEELNMKMALPRERSDAIYAAAKGLQENAQEEYNSQKSAERSIGADLHLIGNVKSVLEAILRVANRYERDYRPA